MTTSTGGRVQRAVVATAAALVIAGVWGAFAVTQIGYAWPYPQVLPDTISFHGATYFKQPGCHTRRWWDRHGGISGAQTAGQVGTLTKRGRRQRDTRVRPPPDCVQRVPARPVRQLFRRV
jgi:hypothetical protein